MTDVDRSCPVSRQWKKTAREHERVLVKPPKPSHLSCPFRRAPHALPCPPSPRCPSRVRPFRGPSHGLLASLSTMTMPLMPSCLREHPEKCHACPESCCCCCCCLRRSRRPLQKHFRERSRNFCVCMKNGSSVMLVASASVGGGEQQQLPLRKIQSVARTIPLR